MIPAMKETPIEEAPDELPVPVGLAPAVPRLPEAADPVLAPDPDCVLLATPVSAGSDVYKNCELKVVHDELAGTVGVYGTVVMAPRLSGG